MAGSSRYGTALDRNSAKKAWVAGWPEVAQSAGDVVPRIAPT